MFYLPVQQSKERTKFLSGTVILLMFKVNIPAKSTARETTIAVFNLILHNLQINLDSFYTNLEEQHCFSGEKKQNRKYFCKQEDVQKIQVSLGLYALQLLLFLQHFFPLYYDFLYRMQDNEYLQNSHQFGKREPYRLKFQHMHAPILVYIATSCF